MLTLACPIYFVSGFCLLTFETIWIRTLAYQMGGAAFSSAVVVGVYFLFAALGNLLISKAIARCSSPLRWYGWCELLCAVLAVIGFALRNVIANQVILNDSAVRHVLYAAAIIGLPSLLNGATFPLLSEWIIRPGELRVVRSGPAYAANLAGSALGVICGGILLPRALGYSATFYGASTLLALIGLFALLWSRRSKGAEKKVEQPPAKSQLRSDELFGRAVLIVSGILSILLEILSIHYACQFATSSIFTVSAVLFAFIVNFGVAAWLASRLAARGISIERLLAMALGCAGIACLAYPFVFQWALNSKIPLYSPASAGSMFVMMLTALVALAPLQIPAGFVFPLAWNFLKRDSARHGAALGQIVAWNKVGSAAGALAGPFVLFHVLGLSRTLAAAGAAYLALAWVLVALADIPILSRRWKFSGVALSLVAACVSLAFCRPPLELNSSERLIADYQGADGIVAVVEDNTGSRHIVVNNSYVLNGTERALNSQRNESWLPLALCDHPKRVAFIGMASGVSASAALDYPIERLDAIELIPDVVRAARRHFSKWNSALFSDPRATIHVNDGRFVIQNAPSGYDLIICDLLLPSQEGTSSLYSSDFLTRARGKLASQGKFCLWLPLYQLDPELASIVVRTFSDVFPNAIAIRGNLDPLQPTLALIGSESPIDLSTGFLRTQLDQPAVMALRTDCPFVRSVSNFRLLLLGDLQGARGDFAAFDAITDDNALFAFKGPRAIAPPDRLCGFTFLNWFGKRFLKTPFPSCRLDGASPDELRAGVRAGNYYFAASTTNLNAPVALERQFERAKETVEHLQTAYRISPGSDLTQAELGR